TRLRETSAWPGAIVTLQGEVTRPDGTMTGGTGEDEGAHLLEVRREIRTLHDWVASLEEGLTHAVEDHGSIRKEIVDRQAEIEAMRQALHEKALSLLAAEKDLHRTVSELEVTRSRSAAVDQELEELAQAAQQAQDEEIEIRTEIEAARKAQSDS